MSSVRPVPRATAPVVAAAARKLRRFSHFSFGVISEEGISEPESASGLRRSMAKPLQSECRDSGNGGTDKPAYSPKPRIRLLDYVDWARVTGTFGLTEEISLVEKTALESG